MPKTQQLVMLGLLESNLFDDEFLFSHKLYCKDAPCRLPTEAEWEYACRADTVTPFHFGVTISSQFVNYDGNYTYGNGKKGEDRNQTTPVGSMEVANSFGLYDIHGNVWECAKMTIIVLIKKRPKMVLRG